MYINEIIRITYRCNWKCKFCNVLLTNNFWEKDISSKDIILQILQLLKKYSKEELFNLILSFSWWEPTLDKNLANYIKLAKSIWVWKVQVQTNGSIIYKNPDKLLNYINSWLDEIFIANHSGKDYINKKMWILYSEKNFINFINFYKANKLQIKIQLNIVINKINLFGTYDFLIYLKDSWFVDLLDYKMISFWFVQPNWYAEINKYEILLKYSEEEILEIKRVVRLCNELYIFPDFHFTSPPLCILDYPKYNLEYNRMKKIEQDKIKLSVSKNNLESYEILFKEKEKFYECGKCKYNNYCLGFYKNWISFVWHNYVIKKIQLFLNNSNFC